MSTSTKVRIREINAAEAERRIAELGAILVDAVAHGASVNFMAGLSEREACQFWSGQLPGLRLSNKRLFVADDHERLMGTVMLTFAHQPNAPHRAEIGKMLVHSSARRLGIGQRLLQTAEDSARNAGRTLLLLDTESGSAGDHLYRRCGWREAGRVPNHSYRPDGTLAEATIFYKVLGTHRPPGA